MYIVFVLDPYYSVFEDFSIISIVVFFIADILQCEVLPEGKPKVEDIVGYDWRIDTKYYTADVELCITDKRTIGDQQFADNVQAFIVHFDPENVSCIILIL